MFQTQNHTSNIYRNYRGYTLIEVLIAMAVFAVGILAIFSMQITSTGSNALARGLTENYTGAMDKVEELLALQYNDPSGQLNVGTHNEPQATDGIDNNGDGVVDEAGETGYINLSWQVWENTIWDQNIKSVRVTVSSMVSGRQQTGRSQRAINIDFFKANM